MTSSSSARHAPSEGDTHVAIKLGMEATLNYKDGGQAGAGSWNELTNTKDVTLSLEAGEADDLR